MKIEMGESLLYSWLKHAKECQIVQTNWKPSSSWKLHNNETLVNIMDIVSNFFQEKYGINIFKKSSLEQLLKQAEIDVIGISYNPEPIIYGVDVAFHENGLMYGNKVDTASIIIKKYVRTLMCIIGYFNYWDGEIIFASPNVNDNVINELIPKINDLKLLLKKLNINFKIKFFNNDDFYKSILSPIMLKSNDISDTSELFMRSYQLIKLFQKNNNRIDNSAGNTNNNTNDSEYISISALDELKIGKTVQITIKYILENNLIDNNTLVLLQNKDYCKNIFGINFAVLKDISNCDNKNEMRLDSRGYSRYYTTPLEYNGKSYLLCQEWNDKLHRGKYDKWYKPIINL